jgi:hypothetical protein
MSVDAAGPLVVTCPLSQRSRAIVAEELGDAAGAVYLADLAPTERAAALRGAGALLAHDTSKELAPAEIPLIRNARLLQFTAAGIDWVPTRHLPAELPIAANKGGGTEPMSEHIAALALAAAKRLFNPRDAGLLPKQANPSSVSSEFKSIGCAELDSKLFGRIAGFPSRKIQGRRHAPGTAQGGPLTRARARPSSMIAPTTRTRSANVVGDRGADRSRQGPRRLPICASAALPRLGALKGCVRSAFDLMIKALVLH